MRLQAVAGVEVVPATGREIFLGVGFCRGSDQCPGKQHGRSGSATDKTQIYASWVLGAENS